jgi:hypothetical protein
MDTEGAVRETIREHNREIVVEAIACAMAGLFGTLVTVAVVGFVMLRSSGTSVSKWLTATGVFCGVLFVIGAISSWVQGGTKSAADRFDECLGNNAFTYMPPTVGGEASIAVLLAWAGHGPYAFLEALWMLRKRFSTDERTVRTASRLLQRLENRGPALVSTVDPPHVVFVLLTVGLVKPNKANPSPPSVVITEKGRDALFGLSSGSRA